MNAVVFNNDTSFFLDSSTHIYVSIDVLGRGEGEKSNFQFFLLVLPQPKISPFFTIMINTNISDNIVVMKNIHVTNISVSQKFFIY